MLKSTPCPDLSVYQGLASGQVAVADNESLLQHLEACDACARKIQTLPEQDALIEWIRQMKAPSGSPEEKQLIQRLIQLRKPATGHSSVSSSVLATKAAAPAGTLTFSCTGCGKPLRVKAETAGKKVKCPHCGQVIQAPVGRIGGIGGTGVSPVAGMATVDLPSSQIGPSTPETKSGMATVANHGTSGKEHELCSFLAPAQAADELGRLGSYRVLKVLGAGGMGVVFRAEDPQLQRLVALKAMLPALAANESARQRFLREARAAAALKHDHIVTIFQVGEDRGAPFLAMEFLEGESLDDRIKRERKLPLAEVTRIGREIAEGLEAAHERSLIHRDIKPGNIWLEGKRGRVKILDFGLARSAHEDVHLTQSGAIVGTPAYMPPEQARGEVVDARCDLYSLGCVLYRLCTGQMPFKGDNTMSLLLALATEQPKSVRELNADVPPALADLIMRLLAKDAAQRPATACEVADALDAIDTGEPVVVKVARAPAPPPRRRRLAVAVAGGALLLAAMLTVIVIRLGKPEEGTVTIETDDPDVELVFTSGGKDYTIRDKKTGEEIKLPLGSYQVTLKDGKKGLQLETNQFTLKSGKRELVKVTWRAGESQAVTGANLPAPVQVAEPPPLAEWLKGRTILTVSQDGKGQFKTIQAALDALKPHQVVKVLDRGPYRERLQVGTLPDDTGLISERKTMIESPAEPDDAALEWDHNIGPVEGFRLSGLHLRTRPRGIEKGGILHFTRASGVVLENCCFGWTNPIEGAAVAFRFDDKETYLKPIVVRNCLFDNASLQFGWQTGRTPSMLIERNYFHKAIISGDGPCFQTVLIRHNVFDFPRGVIWIQKLKEVRETFEISNNTATGSNVAFLSIVQAAPKRGIIVRNNISEAALNFDGGAEVREDALKNWQLDHNCYMRRGPLPKAASDVTAEAQFLSVDPKHPDYLRIAVDSPLAKGGTGGAWPSYIGALPPGPAPKDGDWFTRLRVKWAKEKKGSP